MLDLRLYMLQRLSALAMVPFVVGHIAVMIYAIQGGLSAGEILARTAGSVGWAAFYGTFAIIVALHAAIGLRVVLHETVKVGATALTIVTWGIGLGLAALGLRAVWAVTFGAAP